MAVRPLRKLRAGFCYVKSIHSSIEVHAVARVGGRGRRPGRGKAHKSTPTPSAAKPEKTVLVLDDEAAILLPIARYFGGLGWRVDTAREPEEAEALISHRHYDLAILDLRVTRHGGTEGLEVLREIRRRDHATRVVLLSAHVSAEVEQAARALGVDGVLHKPQPLPQLAHFAAALVGVELPRSVSAAPHAEGGTRERK
jgi:CheY-like chemotaxis protein